MRFRRHPMLMILTASLVFLALSFLRQETSEGGESPDQTSPDPSFRSAGGEVLWASGREDPGVGAVPDASAAIHLADETVGSGRVPARYMDRIRGELQGVEFTLPDDRR
jgi:hypothetical protein